MSEGPSTSELRRRVVSQGNGHVSDFKAGKRTVNPKALPFDSEPLDSGTCPLCMRSVGLDLSRHHVLPRSLGGDDVPECLVWVCGDGVRGCHGVLEHRNRDGETGMTFAVAGVLLWRYVEGLPQVKAYVESRKYAGWLRDFYVGGLE